MGRKERIGLAGKQNVEEVLVEVSVTHDRAIKETKSTNYTLDSQDCGKIIQVDTDAVVITLPATVVGLNFTVMNIAEDGQALVSLSPAAADLIVGNDDTGTDDKDLQNTKATAKKGDYVKVIGNGTTGWVVMEEVGTWAREA